MTKLVAQVKRQKANLRPEEDPVVAMLGIGKHL
jgi:hypothetical protein